MPFIKRKSPLTLDEWNKMSERLKSYYRTNRFELLINIPSKLISKSPISNIENKTYENKQKSQIWTNYTI